MRDRLSFVRFLGLALEDEVPDAKTVWLYREQLSQAGLIDALFEDFDGYLKSQGFQAKGGQIINASIVGRCPSNATAVTKTSRLSAVRPPMPGPISRPNVGHLSRLAAVAPRCVLSIMRVPVAVRSAARAWKIRSNTPALLQRTKRL